MTDDLPVAKARWIAALAGTVVAMIAIATVALIVATGSSGTAVVDLEVGECFDLRIGRGDGSRDGDVEVVDRVDVISCDEPHLSEVVLVGDLNPAGDLEYPSDADLFEQIDRRCAAASSVTGADFGIIPLAPTEVSWNASGGRFQCVAVPFGGVPTVGSLLDL
jgi:hypothetical protein